MQLAARPPSPSPRRLRRRSRPVPSKGPLRAWRRSYPSPDRRTLLLLHRRCQRRRLRLLALAPPPPPPPLCEHILRIVQLLGEEATQAPCACAGQGTQGEEAWRRARRLGVGGCACVRDVRIGRAGGRVRAGRRAAVSRAARAADVCLSLAQSTSPKYSMLCENTYTGCIKKTLLLRAMPRLVFCEWLHVTADEVLKQMTLSAAIQFPSQNSQAFPIYRTRRFHQTGGS